ncbi:MAG: hypothetical protein AAF715_28015 [Myxococcota bacterium]
MSRPPHPRRKTSTTGAPLPGLAVLDYFDLEWAHLVELQRTLAAEELGFPPSGSEGDFAGTLMEVSALIAHVLGVYQDRFAGEAFLGTAQLARSLTKHARRLSYEPSAGLAATGFVVLWAKPGLDGTLPLGFGIGSGPLGEKKGQDYELLDDVPLSAALNELRPQLDTGAVDLTNVSTLSLEGTGLDLAEGEHVLLRWMTSDGPEAEARYSAHRLLTVVEHNASKRTEITLEPNVSAQEHELTLLAKPAERRHLFGWDAAPDRVPSSWLQGNATITASAQPGTPGQTLHGYVEPDWMDGRDIFLDGELEGSHDDRPVLRLQPVFQGITPVGMSATAFVVKTQTNTSVAYRWITNQTVNIQTNPVTTITNYPTATIAKTVSRLRLTTPSGATVYRADQRVRGSEWHLGFEREVSVATTRRSTTALSQPLVLRGLRPELVPGRWVALSTLEGEAPVTEVVRIVTVDLDAARGTTSITWNNVEPAVSAGTFKLGNLRVLGNVGQVSHGKTVREVLGGSDGTSPHQRFSLRKTPLTIVPSREGGTPALEVWIDQIRWQRTTTFETAHDQDRVYMLERDEQGTVTVLFGDGRKGAIPSAGKKHIEAIYRIGIGVDGDADTGLVNGIKKAHPVLETASNPMPVRGGVESADGEAIRAEATGLVKTLDRAVSIKDYEDLALTYAGVHRARAHAMQLPGTSVRGVRLVVANVDGLGLDVLPLRRFLDARRDDTIPLDILDPEVVDLELEVTIEVAPDRDPQGVELAVAAALTATDEHAPGMLTFARRDLGQPLFASEVLERLQGVAGVTFVRLERLDFVGLPASPPRVLDTIIVEPEQWLRLQPSAFLITIQEAAP